MVIGSGSINNIESNPKRSIDNNVMPNSAIVANMAKIPDLTSLNASADDVGGQPI